MAIFTVGSTNVVQGAERHGAAVDPPARVTAASVQLVDTDGVWDTTPGTITRWGVQASDAAGVFTNTAADWGSQGSVFQDNLPFGSRDRNGGMPRLDMQSFGPDDVPLPIAPAGAKLRLAIQVTAAIRLGAEIRTNSDV
jgi:hypothetical protein